MALGVAHIVVMGHASCGGVRAFARDEASANNKPLSPGDFIGKWISLITPDAARVEAGGPADAYVERLALASIVQGLSNLRSFPWMAARNGRTSSRCTALISASPAGRCSPLTK